VYFSAHAAFESQLDNRIEAESSELVAGYRAKGTGNLRAAIATREGGNPKNRLDYALFDSDGNRLAGALRTPRPALGWQHINFIDPIDGADRARAFAVDLSDGTRLLVAADSDALEQIDGTILWLFTLAFCVVVAMGIGGDIAHDLRTPLTRLRNHLERAVVGPDDPSAQREALRSAIERTDEVLALFTAILRISEIEGGGVRQSFARVDLTALVTELCEMYTPAIDEGGRRFSWTVQPNIAIDGDRELISQAFINLVNNAQVHTPMDAAIHVDLTGDNGNAQLAVRDNGPGVPIKDRERVIRRFTRLESSRSTPGHGLGLNIVAAIATVHRARLVFDDNATGLIVMLIFPRVDS
jgi:signal transduction histidine kinase